MPLLDRIKDFPNIQEELRQAEIIQTKVQTLLAEIAELKASQHFRTPEEISFLQEEATEMAAILDTASQVLKPQKPEKDEDEELL